MPRRKSTSDVSTQTGRLDPVVMLERLPEENGALAALPKRIPKRTRCICKLPKRYCQFAESISNECAMNSTLQERKRPRRGSRSRAAKGRKKKVKFSAPAAEENKAEEEDLEVPVMLDDAGDDYLLNECSPLLNLDAIEQDTEELVLSFDEEELFRSFQEDNNKVVNKEETRKRCKDSVEKQEETLEGNIKCTEVSAVNIHIHCHFYD
ncbi:unnamed protein product [Phyllotreta striolata]|uniref:Uncharacterized protein n=1 Tax=Phyllotreta striolata TaxID=444603 RepID=A0A9P0GW05_PHYSR|nr:unnamed protein product [Phyllotreta striolata]